MTAGTNYYVGTTSRNRGSSVSSDSHSGYIHSNRVFGVKVTTSGSSRVGLGPGVAEQERCERPIRFGERSNASQVVGVSFRNSAPLN
jgi:hypothetical protein